MRTKAITREKARQIDQKAIEEYGIPSIVLMENAGRGVADVICKLEPAGPVVICCGRGNNGGDGFVVARHLDLRGKKVRVLLWTQPEELSGDAAINFGIIEKAGLEIHVFSSHDEDQLRPLLDDASILVDALLGTGAKGDPREPVAEVIRQLNASGKPIVAVDLPSGLDCNTGQPGNPTIRAAHTCTFVAPKVGFLAPEAKPYVGTLHVLDIGAPRKLLDELLQDE